MSFIVGDPISAMVAFTAAMTSASSMALRHVGFDDGNLFGFLLGELRAVALLEGVDGILALLNQRAEDLQFFFFVEGGTLVDFLVLQSCLHHAKRGEAQAPACLRMASTISFCTCSVRLMGQL